MNVFQTTIEVESENIAIYIEHRHISTTPNSFMQISTARSYKLNFSGKSCTYSQAQPQT